MSGEPIDPARARKVIEAIRRNGTILFGKHARDRMGERKISEQDVINVLRGGWVDPAEWENDAWRYRVCTPKYTVIIEIDEDEAEIVVITTMKAKS